MLKSLAISACVRACVCVCVCVGLHIQSVINMEVIIWMFVFVCFPGVTTHCRRIFHRPVVGFSLLIREVS